MSQQAHPLERTKVTACLLTSLLAASTALAGSGPTVEELAKLTAMDGSAAQMFGNSVAAHGTTALVGAWAFDDEGTQTGSAYIFEQHPEDPGTWNELTKLAPNPGVGGGMFGLGVALSENLALVGAPGENDPGTDAGAAYLYGGNEEGPQPWTLVKRLVPDDAAGGMLFGTSATVAGTYAVVGAPAAEHEGVAGGAVYIFEQDQGGPGQWGQVAKLVPDTGAVDDAFGRAVALQGTRLLVGAPGHDGAAMDAGALYVFERDQGGPGAWGLVKKLTADDASVGQFLGGSVSLDNTTALAGAIFDNHAGDESGSAYIFEQNQGGAGLWGQLAKLVADDAAADAIFGFSVALDGDHALVGAYAADTAQGLASGSAYLYARDFGGQGQWGQVDRLLPADTASLDLFGISAALAGSTAVVGAQWDDDLGMDAGAAYVFDISLPAEIFTDGFESGDLSAWVP